MYTPTYPPEITPSEPSTPTSKALWEVNKEGRERGHAALAAKRAEWAANAHRLRQSFMDESFMRSMLVKHRIRIANDNEPATPQRLMQLCRRAGMTQAQFEVANGCSPERFLNLNPRLPLWAAVALTLEAAS